MSAAGCFAIIIIGLIVLGVVVLGMFSRMCESKKGESSQQSVRAHIGDDAYVKFSGGMILITQSQ